jgi:hypothetical protein
VKGACWHRKPGAAPDRCCLKESAANAHLVGGHELGGEVPGVVAGGVGQVGVQVGNGALWGLEESRQKDKAGVSPGCAGGVDWCPHSLQGAINGADQLDQPHMMQLYEASTPSSHI